MFQYRLLFAGQAALCYRKCTVTHVKSWLLCPVAMLTCGGDKVQETHAIGPHRPAKRWHSAACCVACRVVASWCSKLGSRCAWRMSQHATQSHYDTSCCLRHKQLYPRESVHQSVLARGKLDNALLLGAMILPSSIILNIL